MDKLCCPRRGIAFFENLYCGNARLLYNDEIAFIPRCICNRGSLSRLCTASSFAKLLTCVFDLLIAEISITLVLHVLWFHQLNTKLTIDSPDYPTLSCHTELRLKFVYFFFSPRACSLTLLE